MSVAARGDGRVHGWDLLRGLCALTVACYHLMLWLEIAQVPPLGTYGVYLFFILSGASLAYSYPDMRLAPGPWLRFLAVRWMRLAPLFLLVAGVFVLMLRVERERWMPELGLRALLNLGLVFGLHDPLLWSIPIGGWSLGIEFVFYMAFPLLMAAARRPVAAAALAVLLMTLQAAWIHFTLGAGGWDAGVAAYHQVPAFSGYFFAGCLMGLYRRASGATLPLVAGLAAWAGMGLLLGLAAGAPGEELLGLRGLALAAAALAVAWVSGQVRVPPGRMSRLAAWLGDITYGVYLLHPLLVFGLLWFVLPRWTGEAIEDLALPLRAALAMLLLALAMGLAWASERWFERPLRQRGRRLLAAAAPRPQSEASSMAS